MTSLLLAAGGGSQPKPEAKALKNTERIWLTIRPGFGWNTVEVRDLARKVGLRKIFDRNMTPK